MWPKMLFELLPHLSRLAPVADKFLNSRSTTDKAHEAALAALAADLRGDFGQVSQANSALAAHLLEQNRQVGLLAVEAAQTRVAIDSVATRMDALEERAAQGLRLSAIVLFLLTIAIVLLAVLLFRSHR